MSIAFAILIIPLFGQSNLGIFVSDYPDEIEFSKVKDFEEGVKTKMKLTITTNDDDDDGDDDDDDDDDDDSGGYNQWELSVIADDDLSNGFETIPISSIWVQAKNDSQVNGLGKIYLSKQYKIIAKKKNGSKDKKSFKINLDLKAEDGSAFFNRSGEYTTYIYFALTMD